MSVMFLNAELNRSAALSYVYLAAFTRDLVYARCS